MEKHKSIYIHLTEDQVEEIERNIVELRENYKPEPKATEQEEPNCKTCWDKGYSTQWYGIHGLEDFGGDGFDISPSVHKKYCTCIKGQKLANQEAQKTKPLDLDKVMNALRQVKEAGEEETIEELDTKINEALAEEKAFESIGFPIEMQRKVKAEMDEEANSSADWEEDFDKRFSQVSHETAHFIMNTDSTKVRFDNTAIKAFIRKEREQAAEETKRNIREEIKDLKSVVSEDFNGGIGYTKKATIITFNMILNLPSLRESGGKDE